MTTAQPAEAPPASTTQTVVVTGPDWNGELPNAAFSTIWYFGSDFERFAEIAAKAGGGRMAPVGEAVNAAATRLRDAFIEFDTHLSRRPASLSWLASDMAERNPFTCDLQLDICRGVALIAAVRRGGRHLVVAEDADYGRALSKVIRGAGIPARWTGKGFSIAGYGLKAARAHGSFLRQWRQQRQAARRYSLDPKAWAASAPWLLTWGEPHGLGENGCERFLGMLPAWLREGGLKLAWLVNPASWLGSSDAIACAFSRAREPAVLTGRFFGIAALARAYLAHALLPFQVRGDLTLEGIPLRPFVIRALRRELASSRLVMAALFAGVGAAFKRAGMKPRAVFYVYENQPWEKALLFGLRRHLSTVKTVGVQHAPFPARFLSGLPSRSQWRNGTAPDLLLTIGGEFRDRLIASGAPAERVEIAGALRFDSLLGRAAETVKATHDGPTVLATCSINPAEAHELALKAATATSQLPNVRLLVNFHPMFARDLRTDVERRLAKSGDCAHVRFVDGGAIAWLQQADLLLYNSSSTAFEAAKLGIPALFVSSDVALDLDVMSGRGGVNVASGNSLCGRIQALLGDAGLRERAVRDARDHLTDVLSAPDPAFWLKTARRIGDAEAA